MVSASPLCSSVRGWVSADHIPLSSISEDRRVSYTEDSPSVKLQLPLCKECGVNSEHMQVDPAHMKAGDGGAGSTGGGAPNRVLESRVGNPAPKPIPSELATDVKQLSTASELDFKPAHAASNTSQLQHCLEASPSLHYDCTSLLRPVRLNTPLHEKAEIPLRSLESAATRPRQLGPTGKRDSIAPSPSPNLGNPGKRAPAQIQSMISLSPGFQCSSHFKPGQPVAYFPPANLTPPLCKITLPPALGQIAALREATANQFSKVCPVASSTSTPQLRTHPYHFSFGKVIAPENKAGSAAVKQTFAPLACNKSSSAGKDYDSPLESGASPTIAVPPKQPALGSAPMPLISLPSSSQAGFNTASVSFTAHNRLLNHLEKHPSHHCLENASVKHTRLKSPDVGEENSLICSADAGDMPLDLSAKSKRQKPIAIPQKPSHLQLCSTLAGKNDTTTLKRAPSALTPSLGPSAQCAIFPETLRNGALGKNSTSLLNNQASEASASWAKVPSQGSMNVPGTYVGVASPVLASTLCGKEGKDTGFMDDLQSPTKQVTISIIDQGEQLGCRGRKGHNVIKDPQKCSSSKHLGDNLAGQPNDGFSFAGNALSHAHCTLSSRKAIIPQSPNGSQPAQHQLSLLPHRTSSGLPQKNSRGASQSQVGNGSVGPCQDPISHSPHAKEENWDKNQSPLSNLELIVKQKPLETSQVSSDGSRILAAFDAQSSAAVVELNHNTKSRQITSGGVPLFKSSKKREGKLAKDIQGVSCKQEKRISSELRDKAQEKQLKRDENAGNAYSSNTSRLSLQTQSSGGVGPYEKNKRRITSTSDSDGVQGWSVTESLSPCVKLEGNAPSVLKDECTGVPERNDRASGTKEAKDASSDGGTPIKKCKKLSCSKNNKLVTETLGETGAYTKKSKESALTKQAKKQKKRPVPVRDLSQRSAEESKKKCVGRGSIASVEQLSHDQADGVIRDFSAPQTPAAQALPQSSPGRPRKEGEGRGPAQRRGRRPKKKGLQDNQSPPPSPPPPSPPPLLHPSPLRRPRGRPRSSRLPDQTPGAVASPAHSVKADPSPGKKRRRLWNRKYQNGEYIVEREQARAEADEKCVTTRQAARAEAELQTSGAHLQESTTLSCLSSSPESGTRRALPTRSGASRRPEAHPSVDPSDKPSGKRKFKSKHLSDTDEEKLKSKRSPLGKHSSPVTTPGSPPAKRLHSPGFGSTPKGMSSPLRSRRGSTSRGGIAETAPIRPIPPEVRRLIVNKNAGETLLQRAARLGYQEVVLYCLEKDVREVNRRDNAGYTALHEACSRGWAHIVRVLVDHGADVNCSAQDGTRPIHDAVVNDNLAVVWMLLNHGADPTLATYSGQTALRLAQSSSMKRFLMEYFADLDGRGEDDPGLCWDLYSSSVFETEEKACWDFLLSLPNEEEVKDEGRMEREERTDGDCFLFEFSAEPLLPCYHVQVSLTQGFCNWFLLTDVLRRLKMSARIFRARYPHFEVVGISRVELYQQVSVSQVTAVPEELRVTDGDDEGTVDLVRCVPDLQELLGSTIQILEEAQSR
ncbi:hypothetical protein GJAV_G00131280 [Gymnothorax javanicus]|nr:hypothetical protein GJAV_G00131280 [Gymnothorax javanicus]